MAHLHKHHIGPALEGASSCGKNNIRNFYYDINFQNSKKQNETCKNSLDNFKSQIKSLKKKQILFYFLYKHTA